MAPISKNLQFNWGLLSPLENAIGPFLNPSPIQGTLQCRVKALQGFTSSAVKELTGTKESDKWRFHLQNVSGGARRVAAREAHHQTQITWREQLKGFRTENGSRQGQNLALTGVVVPSSPDSGPPAGSVRRCPQCRRG